jgi:hypothetical protein
VAVSIRALTALPPNEAIAYTGSVARIAPRIEAALGAEAIANRVVMADPVRPALRLEPWRSARSRFRARLRTLATSAGTVVMADVRACYASISPSAVGTALRSLGCDPSAVAEIMRLLAAFEDRGITGLPIGPDPSAVLANAVLASVDRALGEAGIAHLRWVDDVIAVPSWGRAARVLDVLERSLGALGLELAERKTRILMHPSALDTSLPDLVSSGNRATATLRADAHPVPGLPGPHAGASEDGGVDPRRRPARRAGRHG